MSKKRSEKQARKLNIHRVLPLLGAGVAVLIIAFATFLLNRMPVETVTVEGAVHAPEEVLIDLAGVTSADSLFGLDTDLIANRVKLHPWVEDADVTRWPTGTLEIDVTERSPVVLSVSASGNPVFYLDGTGRSLPVDSLSRYNVPLIRGIANGSRDVVVRDSSTLELLSVLADLPLTIDGLVSDLLVKPDGQVDLITVPVRDGQSLRVRLGRGDYDRKMRTLRAFWSQNVTRFPNKRFEWIDLRYEGQIVTKEESINS